MEENTKSAVRICPSNGKVTKEELAKFPICNFSA